MKSKKKDACITFKELMMCSTVTKENNQSAVEDGGDDIVNLQCFISALITIPMAECKNKS